MYNSHSNKLIPTVCYFSRRLKNLESDISMVFLWFGFFTEVKHLTFTSLCDGYRKMPHLLNAIQTRGETEHSPSLNALNSKSIEEINSQLSLATFRKMYLRTIWFHPSWNNKNLIINLGRMPHQVSLFSREPSSWSTWNLEMLVS